MAHNVRKRIRRRLAEALGYVGIKVRRSAISLTIVISPESGGDSLKPSSTGRRAPLNRLHYMRAITLAHIVEMHQANSPSVLSKQRPMMKTELLKPMAALAFFVLGFAASGAALAQRHAGPSHLHGSHGHFHGAPGHYHGGHTRFRFYLGVPLFGPAYYPPYYAPYNTPYYYPQETIVPYAPPVYVEQRPAPALPVQGNWYYCAASKAYYPYVRECPAGWQEVPAQPPSR
jgi:hypothetical protein